MVDFEWDVPLVVKSPTKISLSNVGISHRSVIGIYECNVDVLPTLQQGLPLSLSDRDVLETAHADSLKTYYVELYLVYANLYWKLKLINLLITLVNYNTCMCIIIYYYQPHKA